MIGIMRIIGGAQQNYDQYDRSAATAAGHARPRRRPLYLHCGLHRTNLPAAKRTALSNLNWARTGHSSSSRAVRWLTNGGDGRPVNGNSLHSDRNQLDSDWN